MTVFEQNMTNNAASVIDATTAYIFEKITITTPPTIGAQTASSSTYDFNV